MKTVIVDLDGTLALNQHREHYIQGQHQDWDAFNLACDLDTPNVPVIELVRSLAERYRIVIFSGRDNIAQSKTEEWLERYDVPHDELTMRQHGDYTPDEELKAAWFGALVEEGEEILMTIDDRQRVVDMWRAKGLTCLQVAPGDF